nr:uncharacterized protein LOC121128655 isoform X1 [Lepeophtheirus salmonis]
MDLPLRKNMETNGASLSEGNEEWGITTGSDRNWIVSSSTGIHNPSSKALRGVVNDLTYSPNGSNLVKLVMLGAPGVGKTSIIQQFVWGTFDATYVPTERKETYYPSVILHDHHYELKIVDIPDLPFFPVNSFYNLSDLRGYGLRDATAYIVVFDLFRPQSFEYVCGLYSQICEARDIEEIPILVIGNKTDKVQMPLKSWKHKKCHHYCSSGNNDLLHYNHKLPYCNYCHCEESYGDFRHDSPFSDTHHRQKSPSSSNTKMHQGTKKTSNSSPSTESKESTGSKAKHKPQEVSGKAQYFNREIADQVTSEWKATYRECTAKDSESIIELFKIIMEVVVVKARYENELSSKIHKKCVIL